MKRGLVIHEQLENRVKRAAAEGAVTLKQGEKATDKIQWFLDELADAGFEVVVPEQEIAYNPHTLELVPWDSKGPVVRAKLDMMFTTPSIPGVLFVIDWKTGRVYEKHKEEREFYAAVCALKARELGIMFDRVAAAYVYIDQGTVDPFNWADPKSSASWSIDEMGAALVKWSAEMVEIGTAEKFIYTPGDPQCRWCDYCKAKSGPCIF